MSPTEAPEYDLLEKEIKDIFDSNEKISNKKPPTAQKAKHKLTIGSDEWLDFITEITNDFKSLNEGLSNLNEDLIKKVHLEYIVKLKPELLGLCSSCAKLIATVKKRDNLHKGIKTVTIYNNAQSRVNKFTF